MGKSFPLSASPSPSTKSVMSQSQSGHNHSHNHSHSHSHGHGQHHPHQYRLQTFARPNSKNAHLHSNSNPQSNSNSNPNSNLDLNLKSQQTIDPSVSMVGTITPEQAGSNSNPNSYQRTHPQSASQLASKLAAYIIAQNRFQRREQQERTMQQYHQQYLRHYQQIIPVPLPPIHPYSNSIRNPIRNPNPNSHSVQSTRFPHNNYFQPQPTVLYPLPLRHDRLQLQPENRKESRNGTGAMMQRAVQQPTAIRTVSVQPQSDTQLNSYSQSNSQSNSQSKSQSSPRRGITLVAVTLERRSLDKPWGLGFVSTRNPGSTNPFDDRVLLVKAPSLSETTLNSKSASASASAAANYNTKASDHSPGQGSAHHPHASPPNVAISVSRSLYEGLDLDLDRLLIAVRNGSFFASGGDDHLETLRRALDDPLAPEREESSSSSSPSSSSYKGFFPGDMVLAIDGRPVSAAKLAGSDKSNNVATNHNHNHNHNKSIPVTAAIANYLRPIRSASVWVLRHSTVVHAAACAAVSHQNRNHNHNHNHHNPLWISSAANAAWNDVLMTASSSSYHPSKQPKPKPVVFPGIIHRNPWFVEENIESESEKEAGNQDVNSNIPYSDNTSSLDFWLYLEQDGTRASQFLPPLVSSSFAAADNDGNGNGNGKSDVQSENENDGDENGEGSKQATTPFQEWLSSRKSTWRKRYKVFRHPDEGKSQRKPQKQNHREESSRTGGETYPYFDRCASAVAVDFWTPQGFDSFADWLRKRSARWHRSYSWNQRKRQRIEKECFEKVVHLPCNLAPLPVAATTASKGRSKCKSNPKSLEYTDSDNNNNNNNNNNYTRPDTDHPSEPTNPSGTCTAREFEEWLKVRRYQWKMARRKRKRDWRSRIASNERGDGGNATNHAEGSKSDHHHHYPCPLGSANPSLGDAASASPNGASSSTGQERNDGTTRDNRQGGSNKRKAHQLLSKEDQEMALLDEILDRKEQEREEVRRKRAERPPIEIARFFDATQGIPDDVVAHCFTYLDPKQHGKLLAISKATAKSLKDRHGVWRQLCPSHWVLPRRPRKPWHELYLTRLQREHEQYQKRWDDLLVKCSAALFKRDDLQKIEKIVETAEREFGFDLNYASGVVCERNSILNLAVIHGRHKVVRWLVDTKGADIETSDRGNFTPLLNAAWSGDRWLVRYFLQRRCDRSVVGLQHYTQGIAPPGFRGRTADEWAEKRGHPEVAKLIRLGL